MKNKFKIVVIVMTLLFSFLVGCGAEVPKKELETAKKEIKRAEMAQATEFDRVNLEEARTELQAAEQLVQKEKNEDAKVKALNSIVKARLAIKNAKLKLLTQKLEKNKELIAEANRYHAQKIAQENFKKGVALNNQAIEKQKLVIADGNALNDQVFRTGDDIAKLEVFIKNSDDAINLATQAAALLENALIAAKERIQKLEQNLASANEVFNQLQKDKLIAKNFAEKLTSIREKLNQANEYYKKFKFTEDAEQAMQNLIKAEELAKAALDEANQLNSEGRAQLQALYRQRAEQALQDARQRVNEAERLYQNRTRPAGTPRNPWIPRTYRTNRNQIKQIILLNTTGERIAQGRDNSPSGATPESPGQSQSSSEPANQNPPVSNAQSEPSNQAAEPADEARERSRQQSVQPAATAEQPSAQPPASTATEQNQTPAVQQPAQQPAAGSSDIERELEQEGRRGENMTPEQMFQKMKEKLASAELKYKNKDYVGAWEDAEEAKRLAVKIEQANRGNSTTNVVTRNSSQETVKIWKHYVVQYRRVNTDCLWRISLKMYQDASLWPAIWFANKLKIADPDIIFPGQRLVIPVIENSGRN